jgi:aminoglycoside phosphotransferase (APT) family kinase protein
VGNGQSSQIFFVQHVGQRMVLRNMPPSLILPHGHAVEHEFRAPESAAGG